MGSASDGELDAGLDAKALTWLMTPTTWTSVLSNRSVSLSNFESILMFSTTIAFLMSDLKLSILEACCALMLSKVAAILSS